MALEFFSHGETTRAVVKHKHRGSPVTEADVLVDNFLRAELRLLAPHYGWLSEEPLDTPDRQTRQALFIADPIDGTRGFAAGDPCWAVCVAVVLDSRPIYGIVHAPALGQTFSALAGAMAAQLNGETIKVSAHPTLTGARLSGPDSLLAVIRQAGVVFEPQPRLASLAMRILRVGRAAVFVDAAALAARNSWIGILRPPI